MLTNAPYRPDREPGRSRRWRPAMHPLRPTVGRRKALTALVLAAVLTPAAAAKPAHAGVSPPAPTGAVRVGFLRLTLTDMHRHGRLAPGGGPRRMLLRAWYPARAAEDAVAPV